MSDGYEDGPGVCTLELVARVVVASGEVVTADVALEVGIRSVMVEIDATKVDDVDDSENPPVRRSVVDDMADAVEEVLKMGLTDVIGKSGVVTSVVVPAEDVELVFDRADVVTGLVSVMRLVTLVVIRTVVVRSKDDNEEIAVPDGM